MEVTIEPEIKEKKKRSFFDDDDDEEEDKTPKGPSKFSLWLNKYFHHIDRGGSLKSEITSGISSLIFIICAIFINMQVISQYLITDVNDYGTNADIIASIYFACTIVSIIGTLAIGLVARLPLSQSTSLVFTTLMISTWGASNGLTYYNLLALCFISSIVYALIVSIPQVRDFLRKVLPLHLQKALKAAIGLLIAFYALQLSGLISINDSGLSIFGIGIMGNSNSTLQIGYITTIGGFSYTYDKYHPYLEIGFISAVVAIILALIFKGRKFKHPYLWSLLIGQGLFIVLGLIFCYSTFTNWGRIWLIGGDDSYMGHILTVGLKYFSFGKVFTEGFDFSSYTGNLFTLILGSVVSFTAMSLLDAKGSIDGVNDSAEIEYSSVEKESKLALICNAGINVIAPMFGVPPVEISKSSLVGSEDKAKSGISSLVVGIGLVLSLFAWVVPTVFATGTSYNAQTNMYGHLNSGTLQTVIECSFGVVDALMVFIGLSMLKHAMDINWKSLSESASWIAVVVGTLVSSSIAVGVALGLGVYCLLKLTEIKKNPEGGMPISLKEIGIPTAVLTGIMLIGVLIIPAI